jgi:hypothetical protein
MTRWIVVCEREDRGISDEARDVVRLRSPAGKTLVLPLAGVPADVRQQLCALESGSRLPASLLRSLLPTPLGAHVVVHGVSPSGGRR